MKRDENVNIQQLSVITVINKKDVFFSGLYRTLGEQIGIKVELIEIDNSNSQYDSLSKAYNEYLRNVTYEWIMFCHADIMFEGKNVLNEILTRVKKITSERSEIKLIGVAGALPGKIHIGVSSIVHGIDKKGGGISSFNSMPYAIVQTVDACCFFIKKKEIIHYLFCNELKGFHMCVEELCLRICEDGNFVAVIPAKLWHFSSGASLDSTYYRETIRVIKLHPGISYLNTTSFHWKISPLIFLKLRFYEIRNIMHHGLLKFIKRMLNL